jgi:hypothetical protein
MKKSLSGKITGAQIKESLIIINQADYNSVEIKKTSIPTKTWTRISYTHTGTQILIYKDGVAVTSKTINDMTTVSNDDNFYIGGDPWRSHDPF